MPLEFPRQRGFRAAGLAVRLCHAITVSKRPVRGPPTIEPEAILLHDGLAQRLHARGEIFLGAELPGDQAGHFVQSNFGRVNPVFGQTPGRLPQSERPGQIDEQGAALSGEIAHGIRVSDHVAVALREVRRVGGERFFKGHRRDQHQPPRAARELIEQPVISRHEFRQAFHAVQRFHLTELRDDHRGARGFELPRP